MLKYLLASATILTFAPKRSVTEGTAVNSPTTVDLSSMTTANGTDDKPPASPLEAVRAFVVEMQLYCGPAAVPFKVVKASYEELAGPRQWPELSDKALATLLKNCGCVRTLIDGRKMKQKVMAAYEFPSVPNWMFPEIPIADPPEKPKRGKRKK